VTTSRSSSADSSQTGRDAVVYDRIWARDGVPDVAEVFLGLLPRLPDHVRALDLCCGSGRHALALAARGDDVVAVDHSARAVAVLREAASGRGLAPRIIEADAFAWLTETSERFDAVICFDALHHAARSPEHAVELIKLLTAATRHHGVLLLSFLCDIRYSSGEVPVGRLLCSREEAESILATALAPLTVVDSRVEEVYEPDTFSLHPVTNELVPADYRATRLIRMCVVEPDQLGGE
jgi:SAM-dependent methyltransferase